MGNENYNPCNGCSGEDCVACSVWIERQADMRADQERDPAEIFDDFDRDQDFGDDDDIDENDCDESMDGDHETALESVYGDNSGDFEDRHEYDDYFYGDD